MAAKKARGVVLSEQPIGETDKLLTIFSENGKFKGIAHGSRLPKSKLSAGTRLFSWTNFIYYPGENLARISDADLIEPFLGIAENLEKLTYASYCMDLVNSFYAEEQIDRVVLKLLVYYLYYLSHSDTSTRLLTLAFQLKLALASGFCPDMTNYSDLREKESIYFSINEGSFFQDPDQTQTDYRYRLTPEMFDLLYLLLKTPFNKIKTLKFDEKVMDRLIDIFNHFLEYNINKNIKSYKILKDMQITF